MADGITKALQVVRKVGKAAPKIVGAGLPLVSLGMSGMAAYNEAAGNPEVALKLFLMKFVPINPVTGEFTTKRLMGGLVPLGASLLIGKAIQYFAK